MENFGLQVREIKTDSETEELIDMDVGGFTNISNDMERTVSQNEVVKQQLDYLNQNKSISYNEWLEQEQLKDRRALEMMLRTKQGREAYTKA